MARKDKKRERKSWWILPGGHSDPLNPGHMHSKLLRVRKGWDGRNAQIVNGFLKAFAGALSLQKTNASPRVVTEMKDPTKQRWVHWLEKN